MGLRRTRLYGNAFLPRRDEGAGRGGLYRGKGHCGYAHGLPGLVHPRSGRAGHRLSCGIRRAAHAFPAGRSGDALACGGRRPRARLRPQLHGSHAGACGERAEAGAGGARHSRHARGVRHPGRGTSRLQGLHGPRRGVRWSRCGHRLPLQFLHGYVLRASEQRAFLLSCGILRENRSCGEPPVGRPQRRRRGGTHACGHGKAARTHAAGTARALGHAERHRRPQRSARLRPHLVLCPQSGPGDSGALRAHTPLCARRGAHDRNRGAHHLPCRLPSALSQRGAGPRPVRQHA